MIEGRVLNYWGRDVRRGYGIVYWLYVNVIALRLDHLIRFECTTIHLFCESRCVIC